MAPRLQWKSVMAGGACQVNAALLTDRSWLELSGSARKTSEVHDGTPDSGPLQMGHPRRGCLPLSQHGPFRRPVSLPGTSGRIDRPAIIAFRGFAASQDLRISDQHTTGAGIGEWMRSRDWNALVHCAAVGGITAVALYCLNRIVARITAPITAGLGPSPFVRCDHA